MKVRFRHITVKIYRKAPKYPFYRIAYRADGKRVVRNFKKLSLAKIAAGRMARELAQGNDTAAALTKKDVQSYRFTLRKLAKLHAELDHEPSSALSLDDAIAEYMAAKRLLQKTRLTDGVNGFLYTVATVRRINLKTAAEEFLAERDAKTKATEGKRAALSPCVAYQDRLHMAKFTDVFGTSDVCDLRPEHLDLVFTEHLKDLAPRTRNHFRSTPTVFFKWCVRKSYLQEIHSPAPGRKAWRTRTFSRRRKWNARAGWTRSANWAAPNPNGIPSPSPELLGTSYLGENVGNKSQPQWGYGNDDEDSAANPLGFSDRLEALSYCHKPPQ